MSTGLDCGFIEREPHVWYYELESWDNRDEYDTYGPFTSLKAAQAHLDANHANPGGFWVEEYGDTA